MTLATAIAAIRRLRWYLALCVTACPLAALVFAFYVPPVYRTEVTLLPTQEKEPAIGGPVGGLASLAGFNLGSQSTHKVEAVALLQSRVITEAFIKENRLLPILFKKKWDVGSESWRVDSKAPTVWEAVNLFNESIRFVSEDKKTGIITLAIDWIDPVQARDWALDLVRRTNAYMSHEAIERSKRNIGYLDQQLLMNNIVEVRQALYRLVEAEMKAQMLAASSEDFGLRMLDPPVVPEKSAFPKKKMLFAFGIAAGLILAVVLVLFDALYFAIRAEVSKQ